MSGRQEKAKRRELVDLRKSKREVEVPKGQVQGYVQEVQEKVAEVHAMLGQLADRFAIHAQLRLDVPSIRVVEDPSTEIAEDP